MSDRITQILRCMTELEKCEKDMKAGDFGPMLGYMDWLEELHYHIHQ